DLSFYNVNATLRNEGMESLSAIGEIDVNEDMPRINLDVDLRNFNMAAFSPIGGEVITNIRGLVSGSANVTGDYRNPDISGRLLLNNAGLSIPYLKVDYAFEDNAVVNLTQQEFNFDNIDITDTRYQTKGVLDGTISHTNFSKWVLGLNVSTNRLLVLDTEYNEDALYYGTAFIGGNASIYGPTSELVIDVVGTTRSGTVFRIPINDSESIGDNSFIHFLSPEEKAARLAGEEIEFQEVKGLELNFDLDVTSDALVEIEIDESILRGRGAGTLLIEINTLGKFNMWGDFIANTGEYIFNYGALQKRFEVRPGGSINWSGNPAQADLNMSAVYEAHANPAIILENPAISRRIPVDVIINLNGELLQPDISFDLEYPNAASTVRSELEYKVGTSTNTEMQAFSLLALGQFYTPDVLGGNAGSALVGGVFQSASSGLFSNLLADESGVFQVGLNYEQGNRSPEQTTADRFGVTLSTQISDRVLINGPVGVPVGGVTETVIVGNLEIEFLLNEEGNLRAKIFNRENNIQYIG
ncbi:MAG: translocation/assembly module TamB domain-containing protein, partial [Salinimicrobium sp.]